MILLYKIKKVRTFSIVLKCNAIDVRKFVEEFVEIIIIKYVILQMYIYKWCNLWTKVRTKTTLSRFR